MIFNSIQFIIFFIAVITIYYGLPHRLRWMWLLTASAFFYMSFVPAYILILTCIILADYLLGIWIESAEGKRRCWLLVIAIAANVSMLALFKYFNFFNANVAAVFAWLGLPYAIPMLSWALPVGLSFQTFQSLSYIIEVYKGRQTADRQLGHLALYLMFFPQLVAGPIERPQNLLTQIKKRQYFDDQQVTNGLKRVAWGLFKKLVIADRFSIIVNQVYSQPANYSNISLLVATLCFAGQVYCDFSGYSDIALGLAEMLGFKLTENFKQPYFSRSIGEFWRRWHISLSTWLRDYLFFPLNRNLRYLGFLNILIVFLISGLWHGASWNFVLWGALHGLYSLIETYTTPWRQRLEERFATGWQSKILAGSQMLTTFGLVTFAWIFFRANSLGDAFYIALNGWRIQSSIMQLSDPNLFQQMLTGMGLPLEEWNVLLYALVVMIGVEILQYHEVGHKLLVRQILPVRWVIYVILVLTILNFGVSHKIPFVYFQF